MSIVGVACIVIVAMFLVALVELAWQMFERILAECDLLDEPWLDWDGEVPAELESGGPAA